MGRPSLHRKGVRAGKSASPEAARLKGIPQRLAISLVIVAAVLAGMLSNVRGPNPEDAAARFVTALGRHDTPAAITLLAQADRSAAGRAVVRTIGAALNENGGVASVDATRTARNGDRAVVAVQVRTANRATIPLTVPLKKERGAWRVSLTPHAGSSEG